MVIGVRQLAVQGGATGRPVALALGADLGGTKINLVLADRAGRVIAQVIQPTEAYLGLEGVMANLFAGIRQVLRQAGENRVMAGIENIPGLLQALRQQGMEVIGLGIGVAGVVSLPEGIVREAPNLDWREVPLQELAAVGTGLPVYLENDTNAAALGEFWFGAGQGTVNMLYLGIGTGIGGGIILDGKLFRGCGGGAGEIGHLVVEPLGPPCGSGHPGCLEAMVSGRAIARMAREAADEGRGDTLLQLAGGDINCITGQTVTLALNENDPTARAIVRQAGAYLGMGLASVINLLNPARIVIGGGVAENLGEPLLEAAWPEIEKRVFPALCETVELIPAKLKGDSAVMGIVGLVHRAVLTPKPNEYPEAE